MVGCMFFALLFFIYVNTKAQFSNSNVATLPLKIFHLPPQPGGAGLRGSGNGSGNI